MTKLFSHKNLLIMCWAIAILHLIHSLLRHVIGRQNNILISSEIVLFFLMVAVAIGYYLLNRPKIKLTIDIVLLLLLFFWLILSCLVQTVISGQDYFLMNSPEMTDLEIIIIVYLLGKRCAIHGIRKFTEYILKAILAIVTVSMLFILCSIFTNTYFITPNDGYIGMFGGTDFQINCHRNFVGAGAMTISLICFCLILVSKTKMQKIIYSVFFVIHYFALILSCSRTGILSALVGFIVIVGIVFYMHFDKSKPSLRILYSSLGALISGAIFFVLRYPVFRLYSSIVAQFGGNSLGAREIIDASTVTMNSRTTIWKYCLEIMLTPRYMITGSTPAGSVDALLDLTNNTLTYPHAHNQILQVGISLGIPGMCIFIVLLILIAIKCLKALFGRNYTTGIKFMPCLILAIMIDNMAERYSMFYQFFISYVFFFLCGYVVAYEPKLQDGLTR